MRHISMTRHAAHAFCILALVAGTACTNDTLTEEEQIVPVCTVANQVALSVSTTTTPTMSWTPDCSVAGLFVQRVSDGANMWNVSTTTSPLKSAIKYGVAPQFSTASNATPLVANVQYRAGLVTSQGASIATKLFTP